MASQETSKGLRDLRAILPSPYTHPNASIETPRLLLRPHVDTDAEDFFAIRSIPKVVQWSKTRQTDPDIEATRKYIKERHTGPEVFGREYSFAIVRKDDPEGRMIGGCGINGLDPRTAGSHIGYVLHPDFWGKGYATEAVKGLLKGWWELERREAGEGEEKEEVVDDEALKWTRREEDGEEYLLAIVNKANGASLRVLIKCGFEIMDEIVVEDGSTLVRTMLKKPESIEARL